VKSKIIVGLIGALCLLSLSFPVSAHHGFAGYDFTKTITLKGKVTSLQLINPHSILSFDVEDAKGEVQSWSIEMAAPAMMFRNSVWNKKTLQPGDEIEITGNPATNGSFHLHSTKLVRMSDGKVLQDRTHGTPGFCYCGLDYDIEGLPHPCKE
jgi:hypothetical protein